MRRSPSTLTANPIDTGYHTNEFHGSVSLTSVRELVQHGGDPSGQRSRRRQSDRWARRLGVSSPLHNYHSLALGAGSDATGMVGFYGDGVRRISRHAARHRAHSPRQQWRDDGASAPSERASSMSARRDTNLMMMSRVVEAGRAHGARMNNFRSLGKTGTGNDYRDAWFIGFTPGMVGGVWSATTISQQRPA